jgi:preprotein translocase SecF subunit
MKGLSYIPANTAIPFMAWRRWYYVFSAIILIGSIVLLATRGLNYGIDFKGGTLLEIRAESGVGIGELRSRLSPLGLGEIGLQEFGSEDAFLLRIERQQGGEQAQLEAIAQIKEALGGGIEYRRVEVVGPQVSGELFRKGMLALFAAVAGIVLYIAFRFEWRFAIGAVGAELHDVIATLGFFSLLGLEFNLTSVAALLTIAGYSINDTVVVFDRVRENLRKYKVMPLEQVLDLSLNQTLSRTANTGLTTLVAMAALYFLGGDVLQGFSLAMIWGIIIGTYSSIAFAVPILILFNLRGGAPEPEIAETGEA